MEQERYEDYPDGMDRIMKVAMMQPAFLPWQGFFELIYQADVFVLLDDFQFSVQSYHQRNRFFSGPGQTDWFSVPVIKDVSFGAPLLRTQIDERGPWRRKLLRRLQCNYARTPYFGTLYPKIAQWLNAPTSLQSLADLNIAFIRLVLQELGWKRDLRLSSALPSGDTRSRRVLELLRHHGASCYLAARGSFGYMLEDGLFPVDDIDIQFQDFVPKTYYQLGSPSAFVPYLSVLDALMNIGPEDTTALIVQGTSRWQDWQEMATTAAQHTA